MKKTLLQKTSNILFYILLAFSCYIASNSRFAPWEDFSTLLNTLRYALIFFSGFFHYISYKYNSARILSTIIVILSGIIGTIFSIINNNGWFVIEIIAFAVLLTMHLVSCGKIDREIKIHEFDVKMEDGRYEKVTIKEKIPNNSNQIDVKTILKKLLISILVLFFVIVGLAFAWGIFFIIDSERDFKDEVKSLPNELVSQEYLNEFNLNDYVRVDMGSRYLGLTLWEQDCYYDNDAEYIIVSEPTRIISESNEADHNTYWQVGDNKNFIMNLVDEDFGNYTRAYYINKNCAFPDETNKIVKVIAEFDKELKFSEKQLNYIENLVKNFDDDLISKDENEFLNDNEYLDDYALVFCFEDFDDIYLTCCSIVKDKNGQWYLYKDFHYGKQETISFYDLEKLPQDICDTISDSLK